MDDDSLVVSNGTECDKLYEVLDAIAIYPELIQKILSEVETLTINDVNENNALEDGIFGLLSPEFCLNDHVISPIFMWLLWSPFMISLKLEQPL